MVETHTYSTPDRRELRNFGLVFAGGLIVFFGLLLPWLFEKPWPLWPWVGAGAFAGTGLALRGSLAKAASSLKPKRSRAGDTPAADSLD